jgi:all-trans-8'-apo-beta-carotenal 15,15'-oxygenase
MRQKMESQAEPLWRRGFASLEHEYVEPIALETMGTIPEELCGTLYRNGPARNVIFGERLRHWFDGDGMVHAFSLSPSGVRYRNRFVASEGHLEENRAQRRLWRTFATPSAGGVVQRFLRRHKGKNGANTNIVLHAGTLFALWEGGKPTRIDPVSLATLGEDDLDGNLVAVDEGYSAHPRFDAATGELWNFTSLFGAQPLTRILCRDAQGKTRLCAQVPMALPAMAHDFALTSRYVILKYDPYVLPRVPLLLILGQKSYGQSLSWHPERGGKILLVPRAGGAVRSVDVPPRLMVHVIHAYEEGDDVILDVLAYADDAIMRTFLEVMVGPIHTPACAFPERVRIPPAGPARLERLAATPMELPRHLAPIGARHRHVWATAWTDPASMLSTPVRLDVDSGATQLATMAPGEFAGECVPVRKRGATSDGAAWILTVVLDAEKRRSELRILDGEDLTAPPVARAFVPHMIPFGFHGSFVSAAEVQAAAQRR